MSGRSGMVCRVGVVGMVSVLGLGTGLTAWTAQAGLAAGFAVDAPGLTVVERAEEVTPTTCTRGAVADTYTDEKAKTIGHGSATTMRVASRNPETKRVFVRFDLAACAIPASAEIQTASLRLRLLSAPSQSRTYDVFRLTGSWSETALTWSSPQPASTAAATDSVSSGTSPARTLEWDVTADVEAHVAGRAVNDGWVVRDSVETGSKLLESVLGTREHATSVERPSLVVTYYS